MNHRQSTALVTTLLLFAAAVSDTFAAEKKPAAKAAARRAPHPSLAKIEDVPGLPRVLLIGDSISMGYTIAVRERLKGKANVHRIPANGGPTSSGLKNLKSWLGDGKWDVIHFNWGLHDLKYIQEDPSKRADPKAPGSHLQVPPAEYEKNLRELVRQLQATGARLIWCNTTPVLEGSEGRVAGDELKYNAVAARVMQAAGVPTNDLHAHAAKRIQEIQLPAGNVHYTPEGYAYLAQKVAAEIANALTAN
jgi:acyl-CoA thioesterase-1